MQSTALDSEYGLFIFYQMPLKLEHNSLSLFYDSCNKMGFVIDMGAAASMILPCRRYKKYYGHQNLIAANNTPIHIFGTKQLNIGVGSGSTLPWIFKAANIDIPIIGTDFFRHFKLGFDIFNLVS